MTDSVGSTTRGLSTEKRICFNCRIGDVILMNVSLASPLPLTVADRLGDYALARSIWLLLLAQALSTLPSSATSIFLPAMAADLSSEVALIGVCQAAIDIRPGSQ